MTLEKPVVSALESVGRYSEELARRWRAFHLCTEGFIPLLAQRASRALAPRHVTAALQLLAAVQPGCRIQSIALDAEKKSVCPSESIPALVEALRALL